MVKCKYRRAPNDPQCYLLGPSKRPYWGLDRTEDPRSALAAILDNREALFREVRPPMMYVIRPGDIGPMMRECFDFDVGQMACENSLGAQILLRTVLRHLGSRRNWFDPARGPSRELRIQDVDLPVMLHDPRFVAGGHVRRPKTVGLRLKSASVPPPGSRSPSPLSPAATSSSSESDSNSSSTSGSEDSSSDSEMDRSSGYSSHTSHVPRRSPAVRRPPRPPTPLHGFGRYGSRRKDEPQRRRSSGHVTHRRMPRPQMRAHGTGYAARVSAHERLGKRHRRHQDDERGESRGRNAHRDAPRRHKQKKHRKGPRKGGRR